MDRLKFAVATEDDADEIMGLYRLMIGKTGCTWSEEYPAKDILYRDIKRKNQFCLKDERDCIVSALSIDEDEAVEKLSVWSSEFKHAGELSRLVVMDCYQNRGVAKEMIRYVREEMKRRGYDGIHFLVSKTNPAALACYKNIDVKIAGEAFLYDIDWWCCEGGV